MNNPVNFTILPMQMSKSGYVSGFAFCLFLLHYKTTLLATLYSLQNSLVLVGLTLLVILRG